MVVTCAFYGFINRTTKVTLQVDRERLEIGQSFSFDGEHYIILSVSETDGHYRANVGLAHLHRLHTSPRLKASTPRRSAFTPQSTAESRHHGQEAVLQARLKAAEARLQALLRERDDALKRLDHALQQLERLQQRTGY
jgi:hypothetical protein